MALDLVTGFAVALKHYLRGTLSSYICFIALTARFV